jgi:hypothetical protein
VFLVIGLLSAFALSRVLGTLLFEVGARDPITYFAVGVMLAEVATIACCILVDEPCAPAARGESRPLLLSQHRDWVYPGGAPRR